MLSSYESRLRAAFSSALFLAASLPLAVEACSSTPSGRGQADGGGSSDAFTGDAALSEVGVDASAIDSSAPDASAIDAGDMDAPEDAAADSSAAGSVDAAPYFPVCGDASAGAPYFQGDAAGACYYYIDFSCPAYAPTYNSCALSATDCLAACSADASIFECLYLPTSCAHGDLVSGANQPITLACGLCPGGRRPWGLSHPGAEAHCAGSASVLAEYFARAAYLEAASVLAFERLRDELREHGAPRALIAAAGRSAEDERRHARVMARLARSRGSEPRLPSLPRAGARSLAALARENVAEGCVRETFGALVAAWQAAHAPDASLRRSLARVAQDELRHAALSWAVHDWVTPRLGTRERASVARARRTALRRLGREVERGLAEALVREAGLPTRREAGVLLSALAQGAPVRTEVTRGSRSPSARRSPTHTTSRTSA